MLTKHKLTTTATKSTLIFANRTIIKKHLNTPSPGSSQSMTILTSVMRKIHHTSSFRHGRVTSSLVSQAPAR